MPLHDWRKGMDWSSVHQGWITAIVRYLKPRLPEPYRIRMGSTPRMLLTGGGVPDGHVWSVPTAESLQLADSEAGVSTATAFVPDLEVAVPILDVELAAYVEHSGRIVAAIELLSPRNKDRPAERDETFARYSGYLTDGVNLVLVDVHPLPRRPTIPDRFSERFRLDRPPLPAPYAAVYRIGEETDPGRRLALWSYPLRAGEPLPTVPVPLTVHNSVGLDLDVTYTDAAELAYLD